MPPLAYRVLKQLTLPLKERTFNDRCGLLPRLSDTHFFDVTDIQFAAYQLSGNPQAFQDAIATTFLPAPKTWIEVKGFAWFVCEKERGGFEYCSIMKCDIQDFFGTWDDSFQDIDLTTKWSAGENWVPQQLLPVYLLFINSPKVIGRRQHMPHRGLERALMQKMGCGGMFPLRAWTEIKLEIGPPKVLNGEPSKEAHLTGERALHFCRKHIRVRLGRLEIVRSHWRGDPALGIVQSRYKVRSLRETHAPEVRDNGAKIVDHETGK
jgi:hypothetical protein